MNCNQVRQVLSAYIDDELDLTASLRIEEHLSGCRACQIHAEAARAAGHAAAQPALYYAAPPGLRRQLSDAIRSADRAAREVAPPRRLWWQHPLALSAVAATLVVAVAGVSLLMRSDAPPQQLAEVIGSHVRSLEADHLLDVESSDQHTVKPWFNGKIEFSPPVVDLKADGFLLVGGRLDYLQGKKVAALIYRRNKHVINLFIWPGQTTSSVESRDGFNVIRFAHHGMTCWAISDLNTLELEEFVRLYRTQTTPTTQF